MPLDTDDRQDRFAPVPGRDIRHLLAIMAALRTPVTGCPWDVVQTFETIAPYTIEEAYEVVDAITRGDIEDLKDELGDLLLQVVFHARIAEEAGEFGFGDVVEAISSKMVRRHPHVFGAPTAHDATDAKVSWEAIKAEEKRLKAERKAARGVAEPAKGLLSDVPAEMPGLTRAVKLQAKAGTVGFDWNDPRAVIAKIREEIDEFEAELDAGTPSPERMRDEFGDVLFAMANLGRHLAIDPEAAIRGTNAKFMRRFAVIEATLAARGVSLADASLDEMEAIWQAAKGK
ncbi:MAG: nucleoside triphosphate pyrophosphohydrolase [Hyphomicrobiaceae bacterium]|nr:nucleoside triphosphate pyrophosphohydrolase [Hyphomicrobiaceae bacterium]